jgi:aryl-alcohol dehydrogenase-like predicted oxidoreductase
MEASVVGLGTWAIGGWMWGGTDEAVAIRAVQAAIDAGINLIDTAPAYGFGVSEEIVGKAIQGRHDRAVLATKCGLVWHVEKGEHFFSSDRMRVREDATEIKVYRYLAPETVRYETEQSLKRLKVEAIDLYQTHWQDPTTPIADTMEELMRLKEEGKIRAIGVSNANAAEMNAYREAGQLDSDQEKYSMLDRKHEKENLPYCAYNNLAFLAYSPLALGLLAGKIGPEREFAEGDQRVDNSRFSVESRKRIRAMLDEFNEIAGDKGVTLAQLVIAWTIHQRGCTHALVGARNPEQAIENARAGDVVLSVDELTAMAKSIETHAADIS